MKKIIFILSICCLLFSSCQKRKCKEQQEKELAALIAEMKQELSNANLSAQQIQAITQRYQEKEKEILAECN